MKFTKFNNFTTEEFLHDEGFIHGVLYPDSEEGIFLVRFIESHPEKKAEIEDAKLIIKTMQVCEPEVLQQNLDKIFNRILSSQKSSRSIARKFLRYAATLLFFALSISLIYYLSSNSRNQFPIESASTEALQKGRIVLSDGTTREFETETTTIHQTATGNLTINSDTITESSKPGIKSESAFNQIIIPYGKHSEVTLADGTHIWLNSGSQLSYPIKFKNDSREVYLSGEAFFDVTHDSDRPFYVIAKDVKIKVLGTSFNVSTYSDDQTSQTVLVKGEISVGENKLLAKTMKLQPGERMVYDKINASMTKDKVDVERYSSWVNGYLIFENEPTNQVFRKLERYYNQQIVADEGLGKITFSGKLDLKDDLGQVLDNIAFASALKVTKEDEIYTIKR